ncbi:uncharacterized protein LOC126812551, partial [Patella vulgata]|uniref:uncharacterized protein LOC126812551 n=1 Tax=Patella vulgata TaxID=6465 RepID=UPI0024A89FA0
MCNCTGNVAVCSGHRHLLSYIPKLPANISQLTFSVCMKCLQIFSISANPLRDLED